MNKQNKTKRIKVKDLSPIQQAYINDVVFLQRHNRYCKKGDEMPDDLFDDLYVAMYGKAIKRTVENLNKNDIRY
tara:strand:+ start:51 stop:272 length:222 start_codon:yes stop_codon:yes gene_type:complete